MTAKHRHAAIKRKARDVPYGWCVQPAACWPGAHGNITRIDVCVCGAERATNINQDAIEVGGWYHVAKLKPLGAS